ncbi:MAG TPA: F0F1 ATP synthase subunit B [Candidatus Mediterraneibacter cottocaccae]|nr:F0F1 ATP synthase subunit B [Candidatus Mediterraneibacter cottocaccae]
MLQFNFNFVLEMINLIVLFLLLRHFLIGPVTNIMEKRKALIESGLKNAQDAQDDAMKMKKEYEEALNGAKQESVAIIEKARSQAKSEYDRIVGEAGEKAGSIIESAKESVRVERENTMKELQSQIAGLAVASAAKIVGGKAEDQDVYAQFLKEVGETDEDTDR